MPKAALLVTLGLVTLGCPTFAVSEQGRGWSRSTRAAFEYTQDDLLRKKYYRLGRTSEGAAPKKDTRKKTTHDRSTDGRPAAIEYDRRTGPFMW
ncbi:MAG: hypothetical protein ACREC6_14115 [Hyphomicrobiaceae bacterium]